MPIETSELMQFYTDAIRQEQTARQLAEMERDRLRDENADLRQDKDSLRREWKTLKMINDQQQQTIKVQQERIAQLERALQEQGEGALVAVIVSKKIVPISMVKAQSCIETLDNKDRLVVNYFVTSSLTEELPKDISDKFLTMTKLSPPQPTINNSQIGQLQLGSNNTQNKNPKE